MLIENSKLIGKIVEYKGVKYEVVRVRKLSTSVTLKIVDDAGEARFISMSTYRKLTKVKVKKNYYPIYCPSCKINRVNRCSVCFILRRESAKLKTQHWLEKNTELSRLI